MKIDDLRMFEGRRSIRVDTFGYPDGYEEIRTVRYTSAMVDSQPLLRLTVISGPLAGTAVPWSDAEEEFILGRDSQSHLEIPDLTVSRRHCRLVRTPGGIALEDLGSGNGTFCENRRVEGQVRIPIGGEFVLGNSRIRLDAVRHSVIGRAVPVEIDTDNSAAFSETAKLPLERDHHDLYTGPASSIATLQALLEAAGSLADALSLPELAEAVCNACFRAIPTTRAALLVDDGSAPLTWGWIRESAAQNFPVSRTVLNFAREQSSAVLCNNVREDSQLAPSRSLRLQSVRRLIAVPLRARDRNLGLLYLDRTDDAARFEEHHLLWAVALGRVTALAIAGVRHRERLERENRFLRAEAQHSAAQMVGNSHPMRDLYSKMTRIAPSGLNVLLLGETGTGKELVARAIHSGSPRWNGPFIAINCATLSETLFESEMFGHERGAFTGAVSQRKGKFELAHGGTLFLDELGELSLHLQARLLRVLQERVIERVGGSKPIHVDVRIIAATNRDVEALARTGEFRADLYQRLNVLKLRIPPLRERREDILALANAFLCRCSTRASHRIQGVSPEAHELLLRYDWPGNVRELQNAIERAVILGDDEWIMPEDLPDEIRQAPGSRPGVIAIADWAREAKRQALLDALKQCGYSYADTARALGMLPNNLHRLITKLELREEVRQRMQAASAGSTEADFR